jgi:[ribosomal protein S18]-alanine N-acetyltransferase
MNARMRPAEAAFEPMLAPSLDAVVRVEQAAYEHPWSYANFMDALHSGYQAQMLMVESGPDAAPLRGSLPPEGADVPWGGPAAHRTLIGYFVAMKGVDEVHLLNITVAPEFQGQGWARLMLDALAIWARGQAAQWLWLEVRVGNVRAQRVYAANGFRQVGYRKQYYPAHNGQREDAIVMSQRL